MPITAGDAMGDETDAMTNNGHGSLESATYSFLLELDSIDETTALIEKFTASGGQVEMPFEKAPCGDYYGQVKDNYGALWAFSVASVNN